MNDSRIVVTMIRCSTVLIEFETTRFLTDPWFSMHMRGLPCYRRPGLNIKDLPELDAVLVSHLHPDHFEEKALRRLATGQQPVLFPKGAFEVIRNYPSSWYELEPWSFRVIAGIEVHAVPAIHTLPKPDEINFVLVPPLGGPLFFGGDARFQHSILVELARKFGPFRLALLPVGGTRILGKRTVMSPSEAVEAAEILKAKTVIPIHEGGIWMSIPPLSIHPGRASDLVQIFEARGEQGRAIALKEGESCEIRPL